LSAFSGRMYDFHNILYWPSGMPVFQKMLCKPWLLSGIFKVWNVRKTLYGKIYLSALYTSCYNLGIGVDIHRYPQTYFYWV
jgi:hypothetical protein